MNQFGKMSVRYDHHDDDFDDYDDDDDDGREEDDDDDVRDNMFHKRGK